MDKKIKGNYVECPFCKAKLKKGDKKGTKELCLMGCPKCTNGIIHVSNLDSSLIIDKDNGGTD